MKIIKSFPLYIFLLSIFLTAGFFYNGDRESKIMQESKIIQLPEPKYSSDTSVEEAMLKRRSVRNYSNKPLSLSEISQILWSAQGITDKSYGLRTAPSAGALYPLQVYLAACNVTELDAGFYKYNPHDHTLTKIEYGDKRTAIANAALKQESISTSSALLVITTIYEITSIKYGNRTERYVNIEVGHAGQNIYLQAVSLGIGTVMIGAFSDEALKKVLALPENEFPLAIYPLGKM
jgi:SagB-type dehydrogenase family enzyme